MASSLLKGVGMMLILPFSFQSVSASENTCSDSFRSSASACLLEYHQKSNEAHQTNPDYVAPEKEYNDALNDYLGGLSDPNEPWLDFWNTQKQQLDAAIFIEYCFAIKPIIDIPDESCLCQLKSSCTNMCEKEIVDIFYDETTFYLDPFPTGIVTETQCQTVLTQIQQKKCDELCGDKQAYKDIYQCAYGTPSPNPFSSSPDTTAQPISTPSSTTPIAKEDTPLPTDQASDTTTAKAEQTTSTAAVTTQTPANTASSTSALITSNTDHDTVSTESTHTNTQQTAKTTYNVIEYYNYYNYDYGDYEITPNATRSATTVEALPTTSHPTATDMKWDNTQTAVLYVICTVLLLIFIVGVALFAYNREKQTKKNRMDIQHRVEIMTIEGQLETEGHDVSAEGVGDNPQNMTTARYNPNHEYLAPELENDGFALGDDAILIEGDNNETNTNQ